ncbi:hypothetical protein E4U23_008703 [Claviceps purpurea]|nr:hypothetical protein E4U23_008703 [Claviceps purpurea]
MSEMSVSSASKGSSASLSKAELKKALRASKKELRNYEGRLQLREYIKRRHEAGITIKASWTNRRSQICHKRNRSKFRRSKSPAIQLALREQQNTTQAALLQLISRGQSTQPTIPLDYQGATVQVLPVCHRQTMDIGFFDQDVTDEKGQGVIAKGTSTTIYKC